MVAQDIRKGKIQCSGLVSVVGDGVAGVTPVNSFGKQTPLSSNSALSLSKDAPMRASVNKPI